MIRYVLAKTKVVAKSTAILYFIISVLFNYFITMVIMVRCDFFIFPCKEYVDDQFHTDYAGYIWKDEWIVTWTEGHEKYHAAPIWKWLRRGDGLHEIRYGMYDKSSFIEHFRVHGSDKLVQSFHPPHWSRMRDNYDGIEPRFRVEVAAGWPILSLYGSVDSFTDVDNRPKNIEWGMAWPPRIYRTLFPISTQFISLTVLPLRPIWPGFMVNTLVYFVLISGVRFHAGAVVRVHRRRRVRRGRCVGLRCNYPVPAGGVCPECGRKQPGGTDINTSRASSAR